MQGSGSAKLRCFCGKTMPCCSQVTCLEIHVRCQLPAKPSRFKKTAMATLAGIVAACSARLESLDLRVSWCCSDRCAHNLLVGRPGVFSVFLHSLQILALRCKFAHTSVCRPLAGCGGAVPAAALTASAAATGVEPGLGTGTETSFRDRRSPGGIPPASFSRVLVTGGRQKVSCRRGFFVFRAGLACTATSLLCSASCWGKPLE